MHDRNPQQREVLRRHERVRREHQSRGPAQRDSHRLAEERAPAGDGELGEPRVHRQLGLRSCHERAVVPARADRDHARGLEPEVGRLNRGSIPDERRGDDEEEQRDRDLAGHEDSAERRALDAAAHLPAQRVGQGQTRRLQCRQERKEDGGRGRDGEREEEDPVVEVERHQAHHCRHRRRKHCHQDEYAQAQERAGERQPGEPGQHRDEETFGDELADDSAPARTDREPDADLAVAGIRACEHDVRRIGARRHEHETKRGKHRREKRDARQRDARRRRLCLELCSDRVHASSHAGLERLDRQRSLDLLWRDAAPEPSRDPKPSRLVAGDEILLAADAVHRERRPQIPRRVVEADEFGSHDADDDELSAVGVDLAAEHRRVTAKEPRPAPVCQHGHGFRAGRASIVWHQASPERDTRGERREVVPGYEPDGHRLPIRLDRSRRLGNDVVEEVRPRAHRLEIAPAEGVTAGLLRAPPDGVEAVRIVHGEGAQDVSVENPEDGRHEAHADGQC